jgi:hypothetical protein
MIKLSLVLGFGCSKPNIDALNVPTVEQEQNQGVVDPSKIERDQDGNAKLTTRCDYGDEVIDIASEAELQKIVPGKSYKLQSDITLSSSWQFLRANNVSINGNGYALRGLQRETSEVSVGGLFAELTNGCIENLFIMDFNLSGASVVGGLIGVSNSNKLYNVDTVRVSLISRGNGQMANGKAGGLIGEDTGSEVVDSAFDVKIVGANAGGLIGSGKTSKILSAKGKVDIKCTNCSDASSGNGHLGGVAGYLYMGSSIRDVVVDVNLKGNAYNLGGIIGNMSMNSKDPVNEIEDCESSGTAASDYVAANIGGILAAGTGRIKNAKSSLVITKAKRAGGIAAVYAGEVSGVEFTGSLTATESNKSIVNFSPKTFP